MRLLVIDDHLLLGQMLGGLLIQRFPLQLQAICGSVVDALPLLRDDPPDLLLLDVCLPGEDWQQAARSYLTANPKGALIMVTGLADALALPGWLEPSLLAVVQKTNAWCELETIVARWMRNIGVRGCQAQERLQQSIAQLSPRELRVFQGLGQGLSNREIAVLLGLTPSTVETYRKTIRSKLGVSGGELVRQAVLSRCLPSVMPLQQSPG